MNTPESEEKTESLLRRARNLVNDKSRIQHKDNIAGRLQQSSDVNTPKSASSKHRQIKITRKIIQEEWNSLKNTSNIIKDKPKRKTKSPEQSEILIGVVAYIEIDTIHKIRALKQILENLGATVYSKFTHEVTHIIFKNGSIDTYRRAKLLNVYLVSVLWIEACKNSRRKVPEKLFPVIDNCDYTGSPRVFRKFMEKGLKSNHNFLSKIAKNLMLDELNGENDQPRRQTRSSTKSQNNSNNSNSIVLHVSTDESTDKSKCSRKSYPCQKSSKKCKDLTKSLDESSDNDRACHVTTRKKSKCRNLELKTELENVSITSKCESSCESQRRSTRNLIINSTSEGSDSENIEPSLIKFNPNPNNFNTTPVFRKSSQSDISKSKETSGQQISTVQRRLFSKNHDETIDHDQNKSPKILATLKRKLFNQNLLDQSVAFDGNTSESSDGLEVSTDNPYNDRKVVKRRRKKNIVKACRQKVHSSPNEDANTSNSLQSDVNVDSVLENLIDDKVVQKKKRTRNVFRQKAKEREKKLTKQQKEDLKRANRIAKRSQKQLSVLMQQSRCIRKINIYDSSIEHPSLVSTFLHSRENKWLRECIETLGRFNFKANVESDTTHIVAGASRRTVNMLKGLSRGCWLVSKQWVVDSISAGHWLDEHPYELNDFSNTVQKARLERRALGDGYTMDIFSECGPIYVNPYCKPPCKDIKELITLCNGKLAASYMRASILIDIVKENYVCVSVKWILDSIQSGRVKSLKKYVICDVH